MAIAKKTTPVITPRPGDTAVNITNSDDVVTIGPTTVVTETKIVDTVLVNDANPWRDTQATRDQNTLTEVPGRPMVVSYLKGVSGKSDVPDVVSVSTTGVNQQFISYKNLTLKVLDGLKPETDPETQVTTMVGSAYLVDVLVPSQGDHIAIPMDVGQLGLAYVTKATPQGIYRGRAYLIEYALIELTREEHLLIENKIIQTYHCRSIGRSDNVVTLTSSELNNYLDSLLRLEQIEATWVAKFYDPETYTFVVPMADGKHHDPLMVRHATGILSNLPYIERYLDLTDVLGDIYSAITGMRLPTPPKRDLTLNWRLGNIGVKARLSRINYSGINSVPNINDSVTGTTMMYSTQVANASFKLRDHWLPSEAVTEGVLPNPATFDEYLFDKMWWAEDTLTLLESQIHKYLYRNNLDELAIAKLVDTIETVASDHEAYYYGPIVFFLARVYYGKYGRS